MFNMNNKMVEKIIIKNYYIWSNLLKRFGLKYIKQKTVYNLNKTAPVIYYRIVGLEL